MPRHIWIALGIAAIMTLGAVLLNTYGASSAQMLVVMAALGVVLVLAQIALSPTLKTKAGTEAQPAVDGKVRPGLSLLDSLPTPLLVLEEGGQIAHANAAARTLFPRLSDSTHIASTVRAPALLEAIADRDATADRRTVEFGLMRDGRETSLLAHICRVPANREERGPARLLVQFEDQSRSLQIERVRADFVANASHELRTPLAAIIGHIETLQGAAKEDPPARERFLGVMSKQARRMKRLIEDLMSLNEIELAERQLPDTAYRLYDLVQEAMTALTPQVQEREARIELRFSRHGPLVTGDRDQLVQVFVNLIDNAMKYGGRANPVEILPSPADERFPGLTGVTISDHGPGIAPEHLPRLTERFYRVSARQSRDLGGTGLGLAIVKHVLSRHRGELQIESAPGKGSRFTVWLPLRAATRPGQDSMSQLDGPEQLPILSGSGGSVT